MTTNDKAIIFERKNGVNPARIGTKSLPVVKETFVYAFDTFHFEIGHFRLSIDRFLILKTRTLQRFLNKNY